MRRLEDVCLCVIILGVSTSERFDFGFGEVIYPIQLAPFAEDCIYLLEEPPLCFVCTMAMSFGLSTADNRPELMEEVKHFHFLPNFHKIL